MKEKDDIQRLIDLFMDGQTTIDEERRLGEYFRNNAVGPEWEAYKQMFAYFDEGMTDTLPPRKPIVRPHRLRRLAAAMAVAASIALIAFVAWPGRKGQTSQPASTPQVASLAPDSTRSHPADTTLTDRPATTPAKPQRRGGKYKWRVAPPKTYYAAAQSTLTDSLLAVDSEYETALCAQLQCDTLADELLFLRLQLTEQARELPIAMAADECDNEADEPETVY